MKKKIIALKILDKINRFSLVTLGCGICVALEINKEYGLAMILLSIVLYLSTDMSIDETIEEMVH